VHEAIHHFSLGDHGAINHVINDTGEATAMQPSRDAESDRLSVSPLGERADYFQVKVATAPAGRV
jgi:hypothetical protein